MPSTETKYSMPVPIASGGPNHIRLDGTQPFCVGCQIFIRDDEILAALLATGEMRMFHYLCPNGIREVVFSEAFST